MKKKAQQFAEGSMLPKFTAEDMLQYILEEQKIIEEKRIEENLKIIDENLEQLAELIGRELTETEESDILDIVDKYTPQGEDGMYLYPLLPFDYAWQIYLINTEENI